MATDKRVLEILDLMLVSELLEEHTVPQSLVARSHERRTVDRWHALKQALTSDAETHASESSDFLILVTLRQLARDPTFLRAVENTVKRGARQTARRPIEPLGGSTLVAKAFVDRLAEQSTFFAKIGSGEATRLGRAAAERVLASIRWTQIVGDQIDTTQATKILGVTRQALAKRQESGSILGIPGDGTTWYPTWQFDRVGATVRPEVREIIGAFRDQLGDVDTFVIAAWATTPQPEDLDDLTPARWLIEGRDSSRLRAAAERAAAGLAR